MYLEFASEWRHCNFSTDFTWYLEVCVNAVVGRVRDASWRHGRSSASGQFVDMVENVRERHERFRSDTSGDFRAIRKTPNVWDASERRRWRAKCESVRVVLRRSSLLRCKQPIQNQVRVHFNFSCSSNKISNFLVLKLPWYKKSQACVTWTVYFNGASWRALFISNINIAIDCLLAGDTHQVVSGCKHHFPVEIERKTTKSN